MDALDSERLYREGFADGRREFAAQVRRARAASEAELPALSRDVIERERVAREIALSSPDFAGLSEARLRELAVHRGYLSALDPVAVDFLQGEADLVELDEYLRSPASRGLMQEDEIGEATARWFRTTVRAPYAQQAEASRPTGWPVAETGPDLATVPEVDPALADTLLRENAGDDGITQGESDAARGAISNTVVNNARANTAGIKSLTRRVRSIASSRAAAGLDALAATATTAAERLHDQARRDYAAENRDLRR